ncbi:Carbon monoxide dehydrogenase subunit G [Modestobacter italicus]|uniref:Carbon monoxide dehydrogenase subunit G n=1 Tax=Modestobacter italicus (strain DSM 44449 / CECT 9708 / BC 501) TaxID=2732864 RepID=I4F526_MODI5|nr:SRPBCC family protein [Modestobacter marinus]CCH90739.1 Carbon monoxide dehydrogenase subunit G [Modestobacter marinus]
MQLENSFTVPLPVDEAWRVLLDIDRIAPCMPGAALDSVTGDDFTGRVKVKLGPINLTYQGKGSFIEKDETTHKAVIDARGKDQRGNGTAAAIVTATLAAEGSVTRVDVLTDLNITGRPAQFGRGVMTDVGNKLLGQFADKLSAQLASGDAGLVDQAAAEQSQEPTVAKTVTTAAATAAATTAGVVEEVAASAEGAGGPAKKAAAAAKKTAAAAADSTAPAATAPAKATPAKATPAKATSAAVPDTAPAAEDTAPAAVIDAPADAAAPTPIGAARKAPSKPPTGTTAPPNRPAGGGPAKSTPSSAPRQLTPTEPEPIDLLEVAGGAAFTRYAAPAAGGAAVLVLLLLVIRRLRR